MLKLNLSIRPIQSSLDQEFIGTKLKAAIRCFYEVKSQPAVTVVGSKLCTCELSWEYPPSTEIMDSYNDIQEATEWGAEGIALITLPRAIRRTQILRSKKGTGYDYKLQSNNVFANAFKDATKLEISGTLNGDIGVIKKRVREKLLQVSQDDTVNEGYACVLGFKEAIIKTAKHEK